MNLSRLLLAPTVFSIALGAVVTAQDSASACSLAAPTEHELDPDGGDVEAPAPPVIDVIEITRGNGCTDGDSCQDLGFINLSFAPGVDDQTPAEQIGYRLNVVTSDISGDFLPEYDVRLFLGDLFLVWADGADNDQEAISMTLEIIAIDLSGNQSAPTTVDINHPGGVNECGTDPVDPDDPNDPDATACAISVQPGSGGASVLGLVLVAIGLMRRKRSGARRRAAPGACSP